AERARTGDRPPLLDPIISVLAPDAVIRRATGELTKRTGSRSSGSAPRNVHRTKDGRFSAISASIQAMTERLFRAIGRADMIEDPRFRTNAERLSHIDEVEEPIMALIGSRTLAENIAVFEAAEVTTAPAHDIDQLLNDPQVRERRVLVDVPDAEMGTVPMHAIVPRLSQTPRQAPFSGSRSWRAQARDLTVTATGYDARRISALIEAGIVKEA
ncbi:MAG: CoA transferase, partial [Acetobacteraceae bacterium]|nr:CoA transferase [Acetobacteraceae bacterium]